MSRVAMGKKTSIAWRSGRRNGGVQRMEYLFAMAVPLVFVWLALGQLTGRSLNPDALFRRTLGLLSRQLRTLWRGRLERSGSARAERPQLRYRDPGGGPR